MFITPNLTSLRCHAVVGTCMTDLDPKLLEVHLRALAEQVARVQDLAQAHSEDDALVELPPLPSAASALPQPGLEYVCLSGTSTSTTNPSPNPKPNPDPCLQPGHIL